jgi:hypothetical protein
LPRRGTSRMSWTIRGSTGDVCSRAGIGQGASAGYPLRVMRRSRCTRRTRWPNRDRRVAYFGNVERPFRHCGINVTKLPVGASAGTAPTGATACADGAGQVLNANSGLSPFRFMPNARFVSAAAERSFRYRTPSRRGPPRVASRRVSRFGASRPGWMVVAWSAGGWFVCR